MAGQPRGAGSRVKSNRAVVMRGDFFDDRSGAAYTLPDACNEGLRGATDDKMLGGSAVSRTQLDREAVFFCV